MRREVSAPELKCSMLNNKLKKIVKKILNFFLGWTTNVVCLQNLIVKEKSWKPWQKKAPIMPFLEAFWSAYFVLFPMTSRNVLLFRNLSRTQKYLYFFSSILLFTRAHLRSGAEEDLRFVKQFSGFVGWTPAHPRMSIPTCHLKSE